MMGLMQVADAPSALENAKLLYNQGMSGDAELYGFVNQISGAKDIDSIQAIMNQAFAVLSSSELNQLQSIASAKQQSIQRSYTRTLPARPAAEQASTTDWSLVPGTQAYSIAQMQAARAAQSARNTQVYGQYDAGGNLYTSASIAAANQAVKAQGTSLADQLAAVFNATAGAIVGVAPLLQKNPKTPKTPINKGGQSQTDYTKYALYGGGALLVGLVLYTAFGGGKGK